MYFFCSAGLKIKPASRHLWAPPTSVQNFAKNCLISLGEDLVIGESKLFVILTVNKLDELTPRPPPIGLGVSCF